ncbi:MAG: glycosyltransferase family 39 protein, partial [Deltaproteobacteria bacterium]|nr:glycosyltransferase family 39 protein [Deltaproteobacteria bacterium]
MTKYRFEILISFLLIMITVAVFGQMNSHEFINYDDDGYVSKNKHVQSGWTLKGVIWAFTTQHHRHWHPVTWLSHMTDCQLFGLNAGWHHMSSLFFHIANTVLLFLLLNRATGDRWRSAFVAALFALHPLHVEPVAWIADRKDILCTFFGILTLWAYFLYAERPGVLRYLMVLFFFVLGLMAKSMVVTLPLVLLLMDFWPLRRFRIAQFAGDPETQNNESPTSRYQPATALRLIGEKILLFIILGATIFVTIMAMHGIQTQSLSQLSTHWGYIADTLVHYVIYLGKTIWPHSLTVIYPSLGGWQVGQVLGAGMILMLITVLMLFGAGNKPYLAAGWLWYLITLLPVIGIVQG